MSIAAKLAVLNTIKGAIKNALIAKGAAVTDSTPFAGYADEIENLSTGSGTLDRFPIYYRGGANRYLASDTPFKPQDYNSWEISFELNYASHSESNPSLFSCFSYSGGNTAAGKTITITCIDNVFHFYAGTGSSWDIVNNLVCNFTLADSVKYYIKFGFTGAAYYFDYNTSGWNDAFIRAAEAQSTVKASSANYKVMFLNHIGNIGANALGECVIHNIAAKADGADIFTQLNVQAGGNGASSFSGYTRLD